MWTWNGSGPLSAAALNYTRPPSWGADQVHVLTLEEGRTGGERAESCILINIEISHVRLRVRSAVDGRLDR